MWFNSILFKRELEMVVDIEFSVSYWVKVVFRDVNVVLILF